MKTVMNIRLLLIGAAMLVLQACATANFAPLPATAAGPYTLDAGDELRITVYRLDELTGNYIVSDIGSISLPLLEPVMTKGKTIDQLEKDIEQQISARSLVREASVSVQIQKYRPFFIVGEVNRPGDYPYTPNMTVLTALSMAGGQTFRASTDKITITRTLNNEAVTGSVTPSTRVLPGDTIRVYEGWF